MCTVNDEIARSRGSPTPTGEIAISPPWQVTSIERVENLALWKQVRKERGGAQQRALAPSCALAAVRLGCRAPWLCRAPWMPALWRGRVCARSIGTARTS